MKINKDMIDPQKETDGDKAHRVVRATLGLIPIGGGTAVEVFNSIIAPPLEKRKTEWMSLVTDLINELYAREKSIVEDLHSNDQFITALSKASLIAIHTHQEEKIKALKNVIANSALGTNLDDDTQLIYLNLIDTLTPSHIKLLKFVYDPENYISKLDQEYPNDQYPLSIKIVFPEYKSNKAFYRKIASDLEKYELILKPRNENPFFMPYTESYHLTILNIDFGRDFINFIQSPFIKNDS